MDTVKRGRKVGQTFVAGYSKARIRVAVADRMEKSEYWDLMRAVGQPKGPTAEAVEDGKRVFFFDVRPSRANDLTRKLRSMRLAGGRINASVVDPDAVKAELVA
jgi:bisphosphoglycerate-independent phosphoglycerate mutase (AlkP superfamily)